MKQKILYYLSEVRPECDFYNSIDFISEGLLDSFDIVALVTTLDEDFGISIEGTDILPENFRNVDSIIQLLVKNGAAV